MSQGQPHILRVLPGNIANMIAAGEVVQRPASVVKELVENAVDAGATSVTVVITDSGRTLIQVIDNGCGMSKEDAILCFERHATSKISSAEDLEGIETYGFRGEALASIAAVAQVTLRTRRPQDSTATEVIINGGGEPHTAEVSAPVGSNFSVRDLFYNVPARRKFLKSDSVEYKHIVEEFTHIALTRPEVGFSLMSNGREVFVLKPAKSLKFRILDLLGTGVVGDIVDLQADTTIAHISGFIGRPDASRKTPGNQYFFVNGRYFRSAYFHKAVMKAYEDFVPQGMTPSYFIYFDVDPRTVDVNIHPTKTEVKFEEEPVLFQVLYACVKETLGKSSFGAAIDFDTEGKVEMPVMTPSFEDFRPGGLPQRQMDPDYNPFASSPVTVNYPHTDTDNAGGHHDGQDFSRYIDKKDNYGALFEEKVLQTTRVITLHDKYLVSPVSSGLMVVNIRRARERVLYESFMESFSHGEHVSQSALFPVKVQVGVANRAVFDAHAKQLSDLGFDISPLGEDTIVVGGVPQGYSCEQGKVEQMVSDLLIILSEDYSSLEAVMQQSLASRLAMLGASSSGPVTSPYEAQKLLEALLACSNAEYTDNGRRIISVISMDDVEKLF